MGKPPLTQAEFQAASGVTDSVLSGLATYAALLEKWQKKINLVGRGSLADLWRRHMLDSTQLHGLLPPAAQAVQTVVDMGSGAGFPGMVLAIMGGVRVHLVESNQRKCAFLEAVNRETGAGAVIHNARVEALAETLAEPLAAEVVTARACAPLDRLLGYAEPFLGSGGICLFHKGRKAEGELTESAKKWTLEVNRIESLSDPAGVILRLERISRRHG